MNKQMIDVTEDGFRIIVNDGECDIHVADIDAKDALMLMSAGIKLKQSEHAGEFLAKFLYDHRSIDENQIN